MVHPRSAQPLTAATSSVPPQTWLLLIAAWAVVGAFTVFGAGWLGPSMTPVTAGIAFAALFVTILAASFGVVEEADHLAHALGEPYGTLILTLSIVLIEVVLIASVLLGPGDFPTIGRDSIFAVMMIIMNLVMGLCLIAGHGRNGHQRYNAQGTASYLSMVVLLASIALVLPKYLSGAGEFTRVQAIGSRPSPPWSMRSSSACRCAATASSTWSTRRAAMPTRPAMPSACCPSPRGRTRSSSCCARPC